MIRAGPPSPAKATAATPAAPPVALFAYDGTKRIIPGDRIRSFAVGESTALSSTELHRFKSHSEAIVRGLAARLSLFLRIDFTLELVAVDNMSITKYGEVTPAPRHMILFKVEPLRGIGLLDVPPPLALAIADRMLGGKGYSVNPNRTLREVELALVNQMGEITLKEWSRHWHNKEPLRPVLLGHENNPRFLQIGSSDDVYYLLKMEAGLGDCIDQIQLLLPVKMLDPLVRQLSVDTDANKKDAQAKPVGSPRWNDAFGEVNMRVTAAWTGKQIRTRELLNFKVGDVVPLDADQLNKVELCIAGKPKFVGRLGSAGSKAAVEITDLLSR
jgi:flagellar motor switch protein FliM